MSSTNISPNSSKKNFNNFDFVLAGCSDEIKETQITSNTYRSYGSNSSRSPTKPIGVKFELFSNCQKKDLYTNRSENRNRIS